jgi:hypothetical protein
MTVRRLVVTAAATTAVLAGATTAYAVNSPAHLKGNGSGTWTVMPSNPDTGTQRVVHGRGHFGFGAAKIRGSVTSPGFIANGDCSVSITLKNGGGSSGIVGHSKRTPSSYPTCIGPFRFHFHTVKASGFLTGDSYKGVGRFDLATESSDMTDQGTFTLKLSKLSA